MAPGQGWRAFLRHVPKLSINFEEILSRTHGNCEEQSKVLESSIIIIIIIIIIINYWIFIINAQYFVINV